MPVVKSISNSDLAALASRLRLTLIRDRMEEMLSLATERSCLLVKRSNFSLDKKFSNEKRIESVKALWERIFLPYEV